MTSVPLLERDQTWPVHTCPTQAASFFSPLPLVLSAVPHASRQARRVPTRRSTPKLQLAAPRSSSDASRPGSIARRSNSAAPAACARPFSCAQGFAVAGTLLFPLLPARLSPPIMKGPEVPCLDAPRTATLDGHAVPISHAYFVFFCAESEDTLSC